MKTSQTNKHTEGQICINKKIEEMLSVLEERSKMIAENYRKIKITEEEQASGSDLKGSSQPASPCLP